jgi:hypothetical protein
MVDYLDVVYVIKHTIIIHHIINVNNLVVNVNLHCV